MSDHRQRNLIKPNIGEQNLKKPEIQAVPVIFCYGCRADYSAKTAEQQGFQLLQKTSVAEAIAQAQEARSIRTELSKT